MPDYPMNHPRGPCVLRLTPVGQQALDRARAWTAADGPCLLVSRVRSTRARSGIDPLGRLDFPALLELRSFLDRLVADQFAALHQSLAARAAESSPLPAPPDRETAS